jgi:hypothetical protein
MTVDRNLELSTLVALARAGKVSAQAQKKIFARLSSPWAKKMAEGILHDESGLQPAEKQDLQAVRELAGVLR